MGYLPVLCEHNNPRLLRSSTDRKGAAGDVERTKHTTSVPCFSTDVTLGAAGCQKQPVYPDVTSEVRALGNNRLFPALCHANSVSCRFDQDAACTWDALAASLPSFHGVGWAEEQGKRSEMEDGTVVIRDFGGLPGAWLLAIYDGHGGRATVSLLLRRLHENLSQLLQERGDRRWHRLKRQAQCRRSIIADSLKPQQQRLQARLKCKSQWRQRRLYLDAQGKTQHRLQEGKSIFAAECIDTQTSERPIPGLDSKIEDGVVNQEVRECIDRYWQLLRTEQLLHVLRWMEEAGEEPSTDAQNEGGLCVPPHYLLVCTEDDVRGAFSEAFRLTDEQLLQQGIVQSGATACVSLLRPFIDFERLVTMGPDEFTDHDWQLFCGNNILFPLRGRCEKECVDHDGRRCDAAGWCDCYSQTAAAVGGGAPDVSTPRSSATPLLTNGDNASSFSHASGCMYHSPQNGHGTTKAREISCLLSIKLSVAHLGDSRALLVALDGSCERLTAATDHKASSFQEVQRVEEAGGWVFGERVNGMLAIGRAFGDWCLKLNPEELKVFSAAGLTGINAERTEGCDENFSGRGRSTDPPTATGYKRSVEDKALLNMLRDGIGGFLSNRLDKAASTGSGDDEGGTGTDEEAGEISEMMLSAGDTRADKTPLRKPGHSVARHNLSSRQHALVVSNEPDICTRDILAFQGTNLAKGSAMGGPVGSNGGTGGALPPTGKRHSQQVLNTMCGSSTQLCGLTSPPVLLLLGCDGLFDVCSDHAVTAIALEFLRELQEAHPDLTPSNAAEAVARALIEEAITFRGSTDNVSVTVALLLPMDFCGNEDDIEA